MIFVKELANSPFFEDQGDMKIQLLSIPNINWIDSFFFFF